MASKRTTRPRRVRSKGNGAKAPVTPVTLVDAPQGISLSDEEIEVLKGLDSEAGTIRGKIANNVIESGKLETSVDEAEAQIETLGEMRGVLLAEFEENVGKMTQLVQGVIAAQGGDPKNGPWHIDFDTKTVSRAEASSPVAAETPPGASASAN